MSTFIIRPFHLSDIISLYRICLKTAHNGGDASALFSDPDIVGHMYTGPYALLEPELCFVISLHGKPFGYILGTADSRQFYQRCETEWFPPLREQYPLPNETDSSPDAVMIRRIHRGHLPDPNLSDYPAHLHIDILPEAQGQGLGRKLIDTFTGRLKSLNVAGVHLEVGKNNINALAFYERVGFHQVKEHENSIVFGMHLQ